MNPLDFLLGRSSNRVVPQQLSAADRAAAILRSAAPRSTARAFPNEAAAAAIRAAAPRATARAFPPATIPPAAAGGSWFNPATQIPAFFSNFGRSSSGLTQQRPASAPAAVRPSGGGFNPAVQVPAFFSNFGRSSSGLTQQRPASAPATVRPSGGGFNPAVQVPAFFSRFGRSSSGLTLGGGAPSPAPGLLRGASGPLVQGAIMSVVSPLVQQAGRAGGEWIGENIIGRIPGVTTQKERLRQQATTPLQQITYAGANVPRLGQYGAPVTTDGSVPRPPAFTSATGAPTTAAPAVRGGSVTPPSSGARSTPSPQRFSGGGSTTFAPPAERAYTEEVSRTAQLTAQNPEMQRYEAARQADLKTGDYGKSEDIGMEMWARKNKTLAKAVKPGQAGYDVIQRVLQEDAKPNVSAFTATNPLFPGAQNYFSGQYQVAPGATTPNLDAFTIKQNIPFAPPQSIGQFPFQAPMQPPASTQGFGSVPGTDIVDTFTRAQLSQELLKKFAGLQK